MREKSRFLMVVATAFLFFWQATILSTAANAQYGPSMPSAPSPGPSHSPSHGPSRGYNPGRSYNPGRGHSPNRYQPSRPNPYGNNSHQRNTPGRGYNPSNPYGNNRGYQNNPGYPGNYGSPSANQRWAPFAPMPSRPHIPTPGTPGAPRIATGIGSHATPQWQTARNMLQRGQIDQARQSIDQQLGRDNSLGGLVGAVSTLQRTNAPRSMVQGYRDRAYEMARDMTRTEANNPTPWIVMAKYSLEDQNDAAFRQATQQLTNRFPTNEYSHYFQGMQAIKDQDWATAEKELRKAEEMGVPSADVAVWLKMVIDRQKTIWEYAYYTMCVLLAWAGGLLLLFLAGKVLSAATMRSINRGDFGDISGGQRFPRRVYRAVVAFAGIYYYISLPIVVLLAIALPLSIGYALLMLPVLNIYLIILVLVVGLGGVLTAVSGIRACFVRVPEATPGNTLSRGEYPELWQLVDEVAEKVGTRTADEICLSPGTDLCVFERGSFLAKLRDRGTRVVILGVALLDGLPQLSLRSILAHEFGHFLHRDTAGGDIALSANRAMANFGDAILAKGPPRWHDIAVHFLKLYYFLFRRLSFGASRLQEVLSDRVAAAAYGPKPFQTGLIHVIKRSLDFDQRADRAMDDAIAGAAEGISFYGPATPPEIYQRVELDSLLNEVLKRPSTLDDTHPSPNERFELVRKQSFDAGGNGPADKSLTWALFPNRPKIEEDMANLMNALLAVEVARIKEMHKAMLHYFNTAGGANTTVEILEQRAQIRFIQGKNLEALHDLDRAVSLLEYSPVLRVNRAMVHKEMGNFEAAAADLRFLVESCPHGKAFESYFWLGECREKDGQLSKAKEAFTTALSLNKGAPVAILALARVHAQLGEHDQAEQYFDTLIKKLPRCADAYSERGAMYQARGNYQEALKDFSRASALAPYFDTPRLRMAWLLCTCPDVSYRDGKRALAEVKTVRKHTRQKVYSLDVMAAACAELGHYDRATSITQEVLALVPADKKPSYESRLQSYRQEKPFRDHPPTMPGRFEPPV